MATPSSSRAVPSSSVAEPSSEVEPSWARPSSFVAGPLASKGGTSAEPSVAALAAVDMAIAEVEHIAWVGHTVVACLAVQHIEVVIVVEPPLLVAAVVAQQQPFRCCCDRRGAFLSGVSYGCVLQFLK